ncbi:hypothetical protein Rhopal_003516-T1 [Rhodotorula paludigena]|uniref:Carboxylic ester hydrolase n=1 Tax=Rhodotorula paludigena TaxID=86838 RepID=A0AAV5GKX8_9BASI|nr:hypothetical protein Rhopal_003516-T1 [Rhodotorula paludigena]
MHLSLASLFATLVLTHNALAAPSSASSGASSGDAGGPVVDLGKYGKWLGTVQNNGTVHSWKAIPYAAPPVDDLRFKAPRPLARQNSTVQDVSADFDGHITACVQFGTTSFVGVNASPGTEDCLKLWVWAPAGAKKGDKLPVHVYTHGGGMLNSQSPNNDFSDWVGQDKGFIAVNANYRLGLLANWNSVASHAEGEPGNLGLLDSRYAVDWVKNNIAAFGGDPHNIAIAGQSGGGGVIMSQLVLYDGKKPNYQKAIPRSNQNYAAYRIEELTTRNDAFAKLVNCTDSAATEEGAKKQLACMRGVPAEAIRLAALDFSQTKQENGFAWPNWHPSVDGKTLTDQPIRLLNEGKVAKVSVITGDVTNENGWLNPHPNGNFTALVTSSIGPAVTPELLAEMERIYPAPFPNGTADTNTYTTEDNRGWQFLDENTFNSAGFAIAQAAKNKGQQSWYYRFNAPQTQKYPAYYGASHSADNWHLQNATSEMNVTETAVANEFRAYLSSFLKHGNPNKERLDTSAEWLETSTTPRFAPRLVVQQQLAASANLSLPTGTAMELVPSNEYDRLRLWTSETIINATRQ